MEKEGLTIVWAVERFHHIVFQYNANHLLKTLQTIFQGIVKISQLGFKRDLLKNMSV